MLCYIKGTLQILSCKTVYKEKEEERDMGETHIRKTFNFVLFCVISFVFS